MIATDKPNPFQVLRLPTSADDEVIVRRGEELANTTTDDDERRLVTWAVEELITHPRTRATHELFEMPDTSYDDDAWERFVRLHRRNPLQAATEPQPVAPVDAFDLVALVNALVEELSRTQQPDITLALTTPPFAPSIGPSPLEARDVMFG
jgi:hypothetical protein